MSSNGGFVHCSCENNATLTLVRSFVRGFVLRSHSQCAKRPFKPLLSKYTSYSVGASGLHDRRLESSEMYEVCSENNGNFLISRVWRVLLSNFFLFLMLVYMPLKYDEIFSCIHCLLCLWQPLRLEVFL